MALMKRQVSNNIKKSHSSAAEISKLTDKGVTSNNLIITGMIHTGAGHVELAKTGNQDLEKAT